ncbi:hypothetical protein NGRA_2612 [Nosema granulosis]|uniref:Uncharacterized protein n=1 Tax=Nosema granulosis TaxID=83296 RepID=A0A9P6GWR0_9MICR|nr:hypothetical protein NGRA_2612 [Nosema granulosis]
MSGKSTIQKQNNGNLFYEQNESIFIYKQKLDRLCRIKYITEAEITIYTKAYAKMVNFCMRFLEIIKECKDINLDIEFYQNLLIVNDVELQKKLFNTDLFKPVVDFLYKMVEINEKFLDYQFTLPKNSHIHEQYYLISFLKVYNTFLSNTESYLVPPFMLRLTQKKAWYSFLYEGAKPHYILPEDTYSLIFSLYGRLIQSTSKMFLPLSSCKGEINSLIKTIDKNTKKIMNKARTINSIREAKDQESNSLRGGSYLAKEAETYEGCKYPYYIPEYYDHLKDNEYRSVKNLNFNSEHFKGPYLYCNNPPSGVSHRDGQLSLSLGYGNIDKINEKHFPSHDTSKAKIENASIILIVFVLVLVWLLKLFILRK